MEHILTPEDRERHEIIRACIDGDLTNAEAGARLHLKVRQVQNLKRAVEKRDEAGVVHASRRKTSNRKTSDAKTSAIVAHLGKNECTGFGPTFAQEVEKERHGHSRRRDRARDHERQ